MISVILHLILVILTALGSVAVYILWRRNKYRNELIKGFFWFFVFFIGYHLSLVLPFLFLSKDLTAMAWGYNLAIVFLFLFLTPILKVEFSVIGISTKKTKIFTDLFLLIGLIVILIQIYDFRLPIISESGFIFWNANLIAAWVTSLAAVFAAMSWLVLLVKNFSKEFAFGEKLKSYLLIIGSLAFALSAIFHFPARTFTQILLAFILVFSGTILFTAAFLVSRFKLSNMPK